MRFFSRFLFLVAARCRRPPHELQHHAAASRRISRHRAQAARSFESAGRSLALQAERLRHGRGPLPDGGGRLVGLPNKPTPKGHFTIYNKIEHKRSGSYGYRVQGDRVVPAEAGSNISGHIRRLSDGILVRILSRLRLPSGLRASLSADPRLCPSERGGSAQVLRPRPQRHAGAHRRLACPRTRPSGRPCSGWMIRRRPTPTPRLMITRPPSRSRKVRCSRNSAAGFVDASLCEARGCAARSCLSLSAHESPRVSHSETSTVATPPQRQRN